MATKKTKKAKTAEPVGATLFFEGSTLMLKLTKRVASPAYKRAQDLIEATMARVFGKDGYSHVGGSTLSTAEGATASQADLVSAGISLHEDVISLVYNSPDVVHVPAPKKARGHKAAISAIKEEIRALDNRIGHYQGAIDSAQKNLDGNRDLLRSNIQARHDLIESMKVLKA